MPSSLLFAGLVATWLAVLVPMAARRRQPMPRPSEAALSCRVLHRPRRHDQEVNPVDDATADGEPTAAVAPEPDRHRPRDQDPYPAIRYRPGRGGDDPRVAAEAAQADTTMRAARRGYGQPLAADASRYVFRQRLVLALLLLAVTTGVLAGGLRLTAGWYLHAAIDLCLVGYLTYLRRQVRLEQAIRARRAARIAAGERAAASRRRPRTVAEEVAARAAEAAATQDDTSPAAAQPEPRELTSADEQDEHGKHGEHDVRPALPRLPRAQLPEQPSGTVVLELDDEDPDLHDLTWQPWRGYRRAAGQ